MRSSPRSEAELRVHQNRCDTACSDRLVDNQDVIYSTWNAVGLPGPEALKRKAVLVDAAESGVEIGYDLLTADNQDDMTCPGDDWASWLPLADAIRSEPSSVTAWTPPTTQSGAAES
jgi:hypothetical protein